MARPQVSRIGNLDAMSSMQCSDLIVLGLPFKTTEQELREYMEQYGEVVMVQIKKDRMTGNSKGFGFVQFAEYEVQLKVISQRHMIDGNWCDVTIPNSENEGVIVHERRVFIGRCTEDISAEDLRAYFQRFGEVTDVVIPKPFRAFAFVTFQDGETAQSLCGEHYTIKGASVHVSAYTPKLGNPGQPGGLPIHERQNPPGDRSGHQGQPNQVGGNVEGNSPNNMGGNQVGMAELNEAMLAAAQGQGHHQ
ncbi:TAR DNA-binding protein 43-like [Branchiostoma floridae]|uniref:TAR DNA-binding protein 43 n=2 Tax=Branchiostoma floridae TaxID=7739 RepID=A0A9J7NCB5_BRAFL|nr:TAR DNA-binding protein 43-like [Branchiostoma floridae]XP_035697621.1 TAR DNA-binding protein 43-like [Branchiostoma floridae]